MLRAYAHEFATIERGMEALLRDAAMAGDAANFKKTHEGQDWFQYADSQLKACESWMVRLPLGSGVWKQHERARKAAGERHTQTGLLIREFLSRWRDHMEDLQFLHVTPALAIGLGDLPPFGEAVDEAFPSSSLEIRDAARCLAFGQGTAAVFHSMRSLEPALIALGAQFHVPVRDNWNAALNDIEKAIRDRENPKKIPNWKTEHEPFYTEAVTHFFIIKNAWRNHTMHLNLRFSEQDAMSVYDHTRRFMQQLATRLSEDVEGASAEQSSP